MVDRVGRVRRYSRRCSLEIIAIVHRALNRSPIMAGIDCGIKVIGGLRLRKNQAKGRVALVDDRARIAYRLERDRNFCYGLFLREGNCSRERER